MTKFREGVFQLIIVFPFIVIYSLLGIVFYGLAKRALISDVLLLLHQRNCHIRYQAKKKISVKIC